MSRYVLGEFVESDLDAISEFIAQDHIEPADRWISRLFEAFESIARTPCIGHKREDLTSLPVRFWPVGAYLIIYRAKPGLVEIVAVTQGSRDVPTFFSSACNENCPEGINAEHS